MSEQSLKYLLEAEKILSKRPKYKDGWGRCPACERYIPITPEHVARNARGSMYHLDCRYQRKNAIRLKPRRKFSYKKE